MQFAAISWAGQGSWTLGRTCRRICHSRTRLGRFEGIACLRPGTGGQCVHAPTPFRGAGGLSPNHNLLAGPSLNIYPVSEHRIWEVERGRSSSAILPLNLGDSLSAGDSILFAHSISQGNDEPSYVKGGDSVRVVLTDVVALGETDPTTGEALFQITWEPLGLDGSPSTTSKRRGPRAR
jgi:hypothetical protein